MNGDPVPSLARRGLEILGVAAAYFGTGKLGLLLAIPPGYATALWPPAGIALPALLLLGFRAWPGVFLGSFLVNVSTSFDPAATGPSLAVAAAIGAGASAQALVGAFLIRRSLGGTLELLPVGDILRFLLLGGPVSCVVGASVGTAALRIRGILQPAEIPFSWWTWWVGDVIGVAVVSPLVLIAFGSPRGLWSRRAGPVGGPLAGMMVLSAALFFLVSAWERARIATGFKIRSEALASNVRARLEESAGILRSLESFHAASPQFNRQTFRSFVQRALSKSPYLQALSWNPRVNDAAREAFEQGGPDGSDGPCRITERDAKDRLVPAPRRSEYVPVRYIEPYEANAGVVGFDVSSGIVRFEAMKQACDSGLPAATRRIRLLQESEPAYGLLLFHPVYSTESPPATPEERRRTVAGYFASVVRLETFFSFLDPARNVEGIDVEVRDGEDSLRPSSLDRNLSAEVQHAASFEFGGRTWSVICRAAPAYVSAARSWMPWGVLAGSLAASGFLGAFLLAVTGRRVLFERSHTFI